MTKAISLYSGGLDSTLATIIVARQNIKVIAINFTSPFGCTIEDKSSCSKADDSVANQFGFELKYFPLGELFLEIVKKPKFGYGKNMNPCIDCRILMLKESKKIMAQIGADFIITGEVLGQRPMSQNLSTLKRIEKESELEGLILRPLSAKLLPETIPEKNGLIDRSKLFAFRGRSRKPQIELAKELGLKEIPQPAGGCLLTDPIYSVRFKDLLKYKKEPTIRDIELLRIGRHFRISENTKLIVGRNFKENCQIEKYYKYKIGNFLLLPEENTPGPSGLILSNKIEDEEIELSASICARYSDKKNGLIPIKIIGQNFNKIISVFPAENSEIEKFRIQ